MSAEGARARAPGLAAFALGLLILIFISCHVEQPPEAGLEKYVTVRLHDSLSRFDSVEVLILAGGDPGSVVGLVWAGRLTAPGAIPSFRLDDAEERELVISVKGWDADGRLALVQTISKVDGRQVVTGTPVAQPSPRLKAMALDSGKLEPAFQPSVHAYSVSLPYSKAALKITPEAEYAHANIFVGINLTAGGSASEAIPLEVGENRVTVTVRAADTTDQYVITATRAPKPADTVIVIPPDTTVRDSNYAAWKYKGLVLLNFQQVGLQPGFRVTGFPLLLRLTRENFAFSQAAAKGADVRFTTAAGRNLSFEIARWDAAQQVAEIFIRADTLEYARTADILMYWGNAGASSASASAKVFDPDAGWGGVWHLEEDGEIDEYRDATGEFDGRGEGDIPARKPGVVGSSQDFRTTNSPGWIELPRDYDLGENAFTVHMWLKNIGVAQGRLLSKDGPGADDQRIIFDIAANTGQFSYGTNGTNLHRANVYLPVESWTLLGLTYDGNKVHVFIDGAERDSWVHKMTGSAYNKVIVGAQNDVGALGYRGLIDEMWSSPVDRGKDYMRLIFENQKPWSAFATLLPL